MTYFSTTVQPPAPTAVLRSVSLVLDDEILEAIEVIRRSTTDEVVPSRSQIVRDLLAYALNVVFSDDPAIDTNLAAEVHGTAL